MIRKRRRFDPSKRSQWPAVPPKPGMVGATLAILRPDFFDALVLVCPGLVVSESVKPHWLIYNLVTLPPVAALLPALFGTWPITPMKPLAHLAFKDPTHQERLRTGRPSAVLPPDKLPLRGALELVLVVVPWLEAHVRELRTPLLLIHGDADRITDPAGSKRAFEAAGAAPEDKTCPPQKHASTKCFRFNASKQEAAKGSASGPGRSTGTSTCPSRAATTPRCTRWRRRSRTGCGSGRRRSAPQREKEKERHTCILVPATGRDWGARASLYPAVSCRFAVPGRARALGDAAAARAGDLRAAQIARLAGIPAAKL